MRKGLPRPSVIDPEMVNLNDKQLTHVEKLINEEMLVLMVHDNKNYPLKGMKSNTLPQ